ncbi:MAG: cbb3-type cytochrome c oxidase subunit I [Verrucomicrobia bacterium]|nr:cbb3-type cytochrome c oxidase subunit I [Verrucomicrobiota bacterium]
MFGRLFTDVYPHDWIEYGASISMFLGLLGIIGYLTYTRRWKWLWKEYLTSLDPKKIGMMYLSVTLLSLAKGLIDAVMLRAQQAFSVGKSFGYLTSDHFQQVFTAHGATMIFFVGMGIIFALMNLVVPLQIGARDVAFPFLNAISFYLYAIGAGLIVLSLAIGEFSGAGWVAYPPLSGLAYNPGVGVDYWIWSVQIAGVGSLLAGINFFVTIIKMRCPGMTLMKMPIFIWSILGAVVLILFAFPILTATVGMLTLDRYLGMHFFTPDFGGNPMMYINLIWAWGHPEVYILVLPVFGVFSEVVATFSQKKLFGYISMVWALAGITFLSFIVWLHHFFTMGASANANAFFGVMTMLIAVPTGVKLFNWLFTMHRGRVLFTTPMLWFLGFVLIFTIGGMTGVLMSIAPADFQFHNSLFLIAHFHSTIIGAVVFGFFAGLVYWFPKITGFKLNERLGRHAFWCWFFGFLLAFMPLYFLGLMGATRRLDHYEASTGWQPLFVVAGIGVTLICIGYMVMVKQLLVSIKERKQNLDTTGDPWNGRTLEWATASPPQEYNFAILPEVHERDAFWAMKKNKTPAKPIYEDIILPKHTAIPPIIGAFGFLMGFCLIWHIMWLAALSLLGIIICMIVRLSERETEECISAEEVEKIETAARNPL